MIDYRKIEELVESVKCGRDLVDNIFKLSCPKQLKSIIDNIPKGINNATTCKEISIKTGLLTKNISSQIKQIQDKNPNLKSISINNKNKKYYWI